MSFSKIAAMAVVGAVLTTAGCGGSKSTTTTTSATTSPPATTSNQPASSANVETVKIQAGKPLTKKTWIARGDAICSQTNAKISSTKAKTQQDIIRLLPQVAAYERAEATELSKLVPPASKTADWQQILNGLLKYSAYSIKAAEYASENDLNGAVPTVSKAKATERNIVAVAKHDGFKKCSIET